MLLYESFTKFRKLYRLAALQALVCSALLAGHHGIWDSQHTTFEVDIEIDVYAMGPTYCGMSDSPIDEATGNYKYSSLDLYIPALGQNLALLRSYNSMDGRTGYFGRGWSSTYDQRLIQTTDEVQITAVCREADGRREHFTKNSDGTYNSPVELTDQLSGQPDGTYLLQYADGSQRTFDSNGRLTTITDQAGDTMTLAYDSTGFLLSVTDAAGRAVQFDKGANGRVATMRDFAGRVWHYGYDGNGNLISFADPIGNQTQYGYDSFNRLIKVIDPRGSPILQAAYDTLGHAISYTQSQDVWTVQYSPLQKQTVEYDNLGQRFTFTYDANGNIVQRMDALGNVVTTMYNQRAWAAETDTATGPSSKVSYDAQGRVTSIANAAGQAIALTYNSNQDHIDAITGPDGAQTQFQYDSLGVLNQVTMADGSTVQYSNDSHGYITQQTDSAGNSRSLTYDQFGNPTSVTDSLGNQTNYTYDTLGNILSATDAEGRVSKFVYDLNSRLIELDNPAGGVYRFTWDPSGNLTSITNGNGKTTLFQYDAFNQLFLITNPAGNQTMIQRRADGVVNTIQRNPYSFNFGYDAIDRLTSTSGANFAYDVNNNLTGVANGVGTLQFQYDTANRLLSARTSTTTFQAATLISYTYDADGRRLTMTDPQGGVTQYAYDVLGRLTTLTGPSGDVTSFTYDAASRRSTMTLPNGIVQQSGYDSEGHLTSLSYTNGGTAIVAYNYSYRPSGIRNSQFDLSGNTVNYNYDGAYRLTSAQSTAGTAEQYQYDGNGNRTSSQLSTGYSYDASDRLLKDDQYTYSWDSADELLARTSNADRSSINFSFQNGALAAIFNGSTFTNYGYDGLGRRIQKKTGNLTSNYIYDGNDLLLEMDGQNNTVASYVHGPHIDELISMQRGGSSYYFITDGTGSVVALTDVTGSVVQTYTYDSFGQVVSKQGNITNPFRFAAREYDDESGLYYSRARYYDPHIGRFISEDPSGLVRGGPNLFAYSGDDPVNWIDPYGLCRITLYQNPAFNSKYNHTFIVVSDNRPNAPMQVPRYFAVGATNPTDPTVQNNQTMVLGNALANMLLPPVLGLRVSDEQMLANYGTTPVAGPIFVQDRPFNKDIGGDFQRQTQVWYVQNDLPCDCWLAAIRDAAKKINGANLNYCGGTTNCNFTAYNLLNLAGIKNLPALPNTPGWGLDINKVGK